MLATISIRAKIISVVAFLLVAMTGMGLFAVMKMRSMNANTVDITTSWMPSVRVLGELRASVITYRNVVRQHMLSGSPGRQARHGEDRRHRDRGAR